MVRAIINTLFIAVYVVVLLFVVGPLVFADGSLQERVWTAVVVAVILIVLIGAHVVFLRSPKRRDIR